MRLLHAHIAMSTVILLPNRHYNYRYSTPLLKKFPTLLAQIKINDKNYCVCAVYTNNRLFARNTVHHRPTEAHTREGGWGW